MKSKRLFLDKLQLQIIIDSTKCFKNFHLEDFLMDISKPNTVKIFSLPHWKLLFWFTFYRQNVGYQQRAAYLGTQKCLQTFPSFRNEARNHWLISKAILGKWKTPLSLTSRGWWVVFLWLGCQIYTDVISLLMRFVVLLCCIGDEIPYWRGGDGGGRKIDFFWINGNFKQIIQQCFMTWITYKRIP